MVSPLHVENEIQKPHDTFMSSDVVHDRHSIRLKGYDYSQSGYYFVTICTESRACLFGDVDNNEISLNTIGLMVDTWWKKLPEKFGIKIDEYVVMPNHFHGIIHLPNHVGAKPCFRPIDKKTFSNINDIDNGNNINNGDDIDSGSNINNSKDNIFLVEGDNMVSPLRISNTYNGLSQYISWFKRMSTNEYMRNIKENGWPPFNKRLWQRNYWEHIIRDEKKYFQIRNYIKGNPSHWDDDDLFQ